MIIAIASKSEKELLQHCKIEYKIAQKVFRIIDAPLLFFPTVCSNIDIIEIVFRLDMGIIMLFCVE